MRYLSYPESDKATKLSNFSALFFTIAFFALCVIGIFMAVQINSTDAFNMTTLMAICTISFTVMIITIILGIRLRKRAKIVNIIEIVTRAHQDFEYARYIAFFYPGLREWMMNEVRGDYDFDRPITNFKAIKLDEESRKSKKALIVIAIIIVVLWIFVWAFDTQT